MFKKRYLPFKTALLSTMLVCSVQAQTNASNPVRGGTLAVPVHVGEPATYDCHASNSPAVMWRLAPHYSTLVKVDADPALKARVDAAADAASVVLIAQEAGHSFSAATWSRHVRG